jgi:hypothetical protein
MIYHVFTSIYHIICKLFVSIFYAHIDILFCAIIIASNIMNEIQMKKRVENLFLISFSTFWTFSSTKHKHGCLLRDL